MTPIVWSITGGHRRINFIQPTFFAQEELLAEGPVEDPAGEYLSMCNDIEGEQNEDNVLARVSYFIRRCSGYSVFAAWPVSYSIFVGDAEKVRARDYDEIQMFPEELGPCKWVCFFGVLRGVLHNHDPLKHMHVLVTNEQKVYGYLPGWWCAYYLASSLREFYNVGAKNVDLYYSMTSTFFIDEEEMYGHKVDSTLSWFLVCCDPELIFKAFAENEPYVFTNVWDSDTITLSSPEKLEIFKHIPMQVLEALDLAEFVPIGRMTLYHRFVFYCTKTHDVYVLLTKNKLIKVAGSISMFLRMRGRALKDGKPHCIPRMLSYRDVLVGQKVAFECDFPYDLPGEKELLQEWSQKGLTL